MPYFSYPQKCGYTEMNTIMHPMCGLYQLHFIVYHVVEAACLSKLWLMLQKFQVDLIFDYKKTF